MPKVSATADREEVFEAGEAFYTPPGHVPTATTDSLGILLDF